MKQKQKISLLLIAIILTAQSCGRGDGQSGEQIQLTWWKPFDDEQQILPLVDEFQKAHPNVRITFVQKNIETYEDELIGALAAGTGPDIFSIHNDWLPKHQDKIAKMPETIMSLREFRDSFVEVASADLVAQNEIYGIPLAVDVLAMYYNRDLLSSKGIARPPATWQELVNLTPKLTEADSLGNFRKHAVALGTAENVNRATDILGLLMLQNGTNFYSEDKREALFDQNISGAQGQSLAPGARALEFYTQFASLTKPTYTWNNRANNSIEAFAAGQVAMIFSYAYMRETLSDKAPFLNYGIAPVPQIQGVSLRVNHANYWAETVSEQSKNQVAAWDFLKFISGPVVLPKYYEVVKQPSSRIDLLEQQISDPVIGVFAEQALSAKSVYKPDSDGVENVFVQMINDVILRNTSAEDAIQTAARKVNLLIQSQR